MTKRIKIQILGFLVVLFINSYIIQLIGFLKILSIYNILRIKIPTLFINKRIDRDTSKIL